MDDAFYLLSNFSIYFSNLVTPVIIYTSKLVFLKKNHYCWLIVVNIEKMIEKNVDYNKSASKVNEIYDCTISKHVFYQKLS